MSSMLTCLQEGWAGRPPFVAATGGMSTSAPWCQLLADVTGHQIPVRPLGRVAGVAGAVLVSGDEALADADDDEVLVYEQRSAVSSVHGEGHARYERLYQTLQHGHDVQPAHDARVS